MGATSSDESIVYFSRNGEQLDCGGSYTPGETLTVHITPGTPRVFEVTGGALTDGGCDKTRSLADCSGTGCSSEFVASTDDAVNEVTVKGAYGGYQDVKISPTCTLVKGSGGGGSDSGGGGSDLVSSATLCDCALAIMLAMMSFFLAFSYGVFPV